MSSDGVSRLSFVVQKTNPRLEQTRFSHRAKVNQLQCSLPETAFPRDRRLIALNSCAGQGLLLVISTDFSSSFFVKNAFIVMSKIAAVNKQSAYVLHSSGLLTEIISQNGIAIF